MDPRGIYGGVNVNKWAPVPKVPPVFILKARNDPTQEWLITHSADEENIVITTDFILPRFTPFTIFEPYDGPYLFRQTNVWLRLFVRDDHLGWEEAEPPSFHISDPRTLTRRGSVKVYKQLYIPDTYNEDPHIAWRDWLGDLSG